MQPTPTVDGHNGAMTSDGDRLVLGPELRERIEGLGLTPAKFAKLARVSTRAMNYALEEERPHAGRTVRDKIAVAFSKLDAGEVIEEEPHVLRVEFRPGVWVTVDADNIATLGDLREVEAKIRRLIDSNGR
jgi:hypothetical protein